MKTLENGFYWKNVFQLVCADTRLLSFFSTSSSSSFLFSFKYGQIQFTSMSFTHNTIKTSYKMDSVDFRCINAPNAHTNIFHFVNCFCNVVIALCMKSFRTFFLCVLFYAVGRHGKKYISSKK